MSKVFFAEVRTQLQADEEENKMTDSGFNDLWHTEVWMFRAAQTGTVWC